MTFPAIFAMVVGIGMITQWAMSYFNHQIPELKTEPLRIAFHIVGEMLTAALLVISGMGLLAAYAWASPLYLVAAGMLLYTVIVSPGYFAQKGQTIWIVIFGVLALLTVISACMVGIHMVV